MADLPAGHRGPRRPATPRSGPRLVLASGSPRRARLIERLGLRPTIRPADVDETPHDDESADALVLRLASAKASASAAAGVTMGGGNVEVVLAADTVVVLDGRILGKPRDESDAAAMLAALSGRTHQVITGLAVQREGERRTDLVTTQVTFRSLTDQELGWYLATGEGVDTAGGYALQGAGAVLVERLDGSDTNVIGLPLAQTVALLRDAGFDALRPARLDR